MPQQSLPRIRVKGSPYDRGRQYGQQAAARIQHSMAIYQGMFAHLAGWNWEQATAHALNYESAIEAYRPHFLDEIRGIAVGADVKYEDILALTDRALAASAFVVLPPFIENAHTWIGQNWDWIPHVAETVIVLEVEADERPNFVTVVEAGLLAKTGMNAAGIGLVTNALNCDLEKGKPGVPYHAILRAILEAENFSEAMGAITSHSRASSANYLVAHRDGESFNAETAPGDFSRAYFGFPENGIYAHTNHYLSKEIDFKDLGPWRGPGTLVRHQRMVKLLKTQQGLFTISDFQGALADHFNYPDSICCHPDARLPEYDQCMTVASMIMNLNSKTMWLAEGNPCEAEYRANTYHELLKT